MNNSGFLQAIEHVIDSNKMISSLVDRVARILPEKMGSAYEVGCTSIFCRKETNCFLKPPPMYPMTVFLYYYRTINNRLICSGCGYIYNGCLA